MSLIVTVEIKGTKKESSVKSFVAKDQEDAIKKIQNYLEELKNGNKKSI